MGNPTTPAWKGYLLAVLMFLSASLQSLLEQYYMYRVKVLQMRIRTAITGLVYRKVSPGGEGWVFPIPLTCPNLYINVLAPKGHIVSSVPENVLSDYFTYS